MSTCLSLYTSDFIVFLLALAHDSLTLCSVLIFDNEFIFLGNSLRLRVEALFFYSRFAFVFDKHVGTPSLSLCLQY